MPADKKLDSEYAPEELHIYTKFSGLASFNAMSAVKRQCRSGIQLMWFGGGVPLNLGLFSFAENNGLFYLNFRVNMLRRKEIKIKRAPSASAASAMFMYSPSAKISFENGTKSQSLTYPKKIRSKRLPSAPAAIMAIPASPKISGSNSINMSIRQANITAVRETCQSGLIPLKRPKETPVLNTALSFKTAADFVIRSKARSMAVKIIKAAFLKQSPPWSDSADES